MVKEDRKYILINGQANNLKVKNPIFEKGVLTSISQIDGHGKFVNPRVKVFTLNYDRHEYFFGYINQI